MSEFPQRRTWMAVVLVCIALVSVVGYIFRQKFPIPRFLGHKEAITASLGSANIPYNGRDPEEVRPDPAEVAVYDEVQKNIVYEQIRSLGREVKKTPDFFDGWMQLGLLKKSIGDYEGTRDAWIYAGIIRPTNSVSFANLGELYFHYLNEYPKAELNFRQSITNKPNDPGVYISLSELYSDAYTPKKDMADDVLLEGLKAIPDDATLITQLALVYEQWGEYKNAVEWWQKRLKLEPSNKQIKEKIQELQKKIGA